jgi:hypothetical protein
MLYPIELWVRFPKILADSAVMVNWSVALLLRYGFPICVFVLASTCCKLKAWCDYSYCPKISADIENVRECVEQLSSIVPKSPEVKKQLRTIVRGFGQ